MTAILKIFGGIWGKIAAGIAAVLAFVAWLKIRDWQNREEGRDDERKERLEDHVEAIEQGRKAEADVGSNSDRDKRLREQFRRD